jgi:rusticyanin
MTRKRISVLAGAAVIAAAGIGTGAAIAASSSPGQPAAASSATPASSSGPTASAGPDYSWYQSMMSGSYGGMMMGGGSAGGWMMSQTGYQWMTGGVSAPGWMTGGTLPGPMMSAGAGTDPGKIMGRLWADAPGPRVSAAQAAALGGQVPAGARIDRTANTITFTATTVRLTVLAGPSGGPGETFRIAGMVNPAIVVPAGTQVSIEVINADPDTAHGLVITASQDTTWMPMMTARPAFTGSALWFLGNPTSAGMHAGTLTFTAATPGTYRYLCPVPGHARDGMAGAFTVR